MSLQHSLSDGNQRKSRRKKCTKVFKIPLRLLRTRIFSSLFVFTPMPHPGNQTSQRPPALMAILRNRRIDGTETLRSLQMAQMSFARIFLQLRLFWMGWMAGCDARWWCGGID